MLTHILQRLLKDRLKKRYPGYAVWLFKSEMIVSTALAIFLTSASKRLWPLLFLLYTADVGAGYGLHLQKQAKKHGQSWHPSGNLKAAALGSGLFRLALGGRIVFLALVGADASWILILASLPLLLSGVWRLFMLIRTGWIARLA